jgi:hypothetical protein
MSGSELIPRCAWCNSFKDEGGKWAKDAPYRPGAYTHGICDDCAKESFDYVPDFIPNFLEPELELAPIPIYEDSGVVQNPTWGRMKVAEPPWHRPTASGPMPHAI